MKSKINYELRSPPWGGSSGASPVSRPEGFLEENPAPVLSAQGNPAPLDWGVGQALPSQESNRRNHVSR
ncbi:hypothetical protein [Brasilonema bromeliae]|uniref:hypothetical protein n=1 Tax=Brasilonema bromeliae TaxID=383615 RepID=UPI00145D700F|nr:hypothetical protein [Brasilonema bromeliae]